MSCKKEKEKRTIRKRHEYNCISSWFSSTFFTKLKYGFSFEKENADYYKQLKQLEKENTELKEYIKKYNKHNMLCFAADMVYKSLNPKSTMCTPNCVYIKIESELENWEQQNG